MGGTVAVAVGEGEPGLDGDGVGCGVCVHVSILPGASAPVNPLDHMTLSNLSAHLET